MSEQLNINDIITLVKETNKQFETTVYVPSMGKDIQCKSMNASHLKNIIKTSVSGIFSNIKFNMTMYTVLRDVLDNAVASSNINILDKLCIMLQLRNKNVKNIVEVEMFNGENKKIHSFEIGEIINEVRNKEFNFEPQTITDGSYTLVLDFPSIDQEFLFDRYFEQNKLKNIKEDDKSSIRELFGPLFIHEISQYVRTLKINDKEIDMRTLSVENRVDIIENLSGSIIALIIHKIDDVFGKQINSIINVEKQIEGEMYKGTIKLDSSLFS